VNKEDNSISYLLEIYTIVRGKIMNEEWIHGPMFKASIYLLFILTANGFLPGGSRTTIRHNTQITHIKQNTHHAQTKQSTQNYTHNKEHTTHCEQLQLYKLILIKLSTLYTK
jgi:hypothetical protein